MLRSAGRKTPRFIPNREIGATVADNALANGVLNVYRAVATPRTKLSALAI